MTCAGCGPWRPRPAPPPACRRRCARRDRVTPLELFFDLVFVLALTQCTALMADEPTWNGRREGRRGPRRAVVVLGRLHVADERRRPRGGLRPASRCSRRWPACWSSRCASPDAFGDEALLFAIAYGVVRAMQVVLLVVAGRDDPGLRHSASGLVVSTAIGVGLLVGASFADGALQGALWAIALLLDVGGPLVIDSSGWRMMPGALRRAPRADRDHRARRVDRRDRRRRRGATSTSAIAVAAVLGIAVAAAQWWLYFDVVALVAARRLHNAEPGRERNRDRARLLLLPALPDGRRDRARGARDEEDARAHRTTRSKLVPAAALLGGTIDLPARARRVPLAQHPHAQPPAARASASLLPVPDRSPPSRSPRSRRSRSSPACSRARRLRDDPLRRGARAPAPPPPARGAGRVGLGSADRPARRSGSAGPAGRSRGRRAG